MEQDFPPWKARTRTRDGKATTALMRKERRVFFNIRILSDYVRDEHLSRS